MPCIQVKTNVSTSREKADAIKAALGQAIGFLPGKSEDWLMVAIEDGCHMYFGGRGGARLPWWKLRYWEAPLTRTAQSA